MMPIARNVSLFALFSLVFGGMVTGGYAANLIEDASFDISDDQNNPTLFNLDPGTNVLTARTGGPPFPGGGSTAGNDAEFVGVVVPAGLTLESITVTAYEHPSPNNRVYIAYEIGSTALPHSIFDYINGTVPEPIGTLFGTADVGQVIFPNLGAGPFAFWIQETNPDAATYTLHFNVVPEPGLLGLAVMALAMTIAARRHVGFTSASGRAS